MIATDLSSYTTAQLVEELKQRQGVTTTIVGPYEGVEITANGPAVVLAVID